MPLRLLLVFVAVGLAASFAPADEQAELEFGEQRITRPGGIGSLQYLPDGRMLGSWGTLSHGAVSIWDGLQIRETYPTQAVVTDVAVSRDAQTLLFVTRKSKASLWRRGEQEPVREWDRVYCAGMTHDGNTIVCGEIRGPIHVYADDGERELARWTPHKSPLYALSVSSNGLLATQGSYVVKLWNLKNRQEVTRLEGMPEAENSEGLRMPLGRFVVFSHDGRYLAAEFQNGVRVWSTRNGKEICRIPIAVGPFAASLSPDGSLIAVSEIYGGRKVIKICKVQDGSVVQKFDHSAVAMAFAWSSDGRQLAASADHGVRIWNVADWQEVPQGAGHRATILAVKCRGDQVASASADGELLTWDLNSGKLIRRLGRHDDKAYLDWSRTGEVISTSWDRKLLMWPKYSPELLYRGNSRAARALATATSSNLAAVAWDGRRVTVHDLENKEVVAQLGQTDQIRDVVGVGFIDDLVAVATEDQVLYWDPRQDRILSRIKTDVTAQSFFVSPDGMLFFIASVDGHGFVYETVSGHELKTVKMAPWPHLWWNACGAFDASLGVLAVGDSSGVAVWNLDSGKLISRPKYHEGAVTALTFSRHSNAFISGGTDTRVLRWRVKTAPKRPAPAKADLDQWWTALGSGRGLDGFDATRAFISSGDAGVAYLRRQLKPISKKRTSILATKADLDRFRRAIAVLEAVGSNEALAKLKELAAGVPEMRETNWAKAAVTRLEAELN